MDAALPIVVACVLIAAGLLTAFSGKAETHGAGSFWERMHVEGPAWLVLVGLGVALLLFGVFRLDEPTWSAGYQTRPPRTRQSSRC